MKLYKHLLAILLIAFAGQTNAQNIFPKTGRTGIGTANPNASSVLDMVSTTRGMLTPRMTETQRDAIPTPATGLIIYQTNSTPGFYYFDGIAWTPFSIKGANTSLSNLKSPTAVNQSLLAGNASLDLGSTSGSWRNLYLNGSIYDAYSNLRILMASGGNSAIGAETLTYNTTGSQNEASGSQALYANSTGSSNSANGYAALYSNTEGSFNTAHGALALYQNTTGNWNEAFGGQSLFNNTVGSGNTACGVQALYSNTNGVFNLANGYQALYYNTTGYENTANGLAALYNNTTGSQNTANGGDALKSNTTGSNNTADGVGALLANITGSNNTALGYLADASANTLNNATVIGYTATVDASNKVRIGNSSVTSIGGQVGWTTFSDGRYKKNIKEDVKGLAFINALRPVTYTLDLKAVNEYYNKGRKNLSDSLLQQIKTSMADGEAAGSKIMHTGFIAQEVEGAAQKLNYDFDGVDKPQTKDGVYGLRYSEFVVPLVKAVQELSKMNDDKNAAIDSLKQQNNNLQKQFDDLKKLVLQIQQTQQQCSPCSATSNASAAASTQLVSLSNASLEQNIPNPFQNSTSIGYMLPGTFSSAKIIITDKAGKALKEISLSGKGKGLVQVDASTLAVGAYNYSLYVNGKLIDSKQMIAAK